MQARSQDLEKGGAILKEWELCKRPWPEFSLFLNQFHTVCPKIQTKFLGKLGNSKVFSAQNQVVSKNKNKNKKKRSSPKLRLIFRPKSEIQRYFPPKFRWSPKEKKKRSSPKLRLIFRPKSEIQTFQGGLFSYGGGGLFSIFHKKSGSKPPKTCDFAGLEPPPPPAPLLGYATGHMPLKSEVSYEAGTFFKVLKRVIVLGRAFMLLLISVVL